MAETRSSRWARLPAVESIELSEGQYSTTPLVSGRHPEAQPDGNVVPPATEPPEEDHQPTLIRNRERNGFRTLERTTWGIICMFVATALVLIVIFSFLSFLWHENPSNKFWHTIVVRGWANQAVALSSFVLRVAVDLQSGTATAMLAALLLESTSVLLIDAAQVSIMRATKTFSFGLVLPLLRGVRRKMGVLQSMHLLAATMLVLMTTFLQLTSTVLLSDLKLGLLPGSADNRSLAYDYRYALDVDQKIAWNYSKYSGTEPQYRATTWLRKPSNYPTFAEYSEPVPKLDGVDDTGVLLRAFIPYADAPSREKLADYAGAAYLLDSRVSCQRPQLSNISISMYRDSVSAFFNGSFAPTTRSLPRLHAPDEDIPFSCTMLSNVYDFKNVSSISICMLSPGSAGGDGPLHKGYLLSELLPSDIVPELSGSLRNDLEILTTTPYLVLNSTMYAVPSSLNYTVTMSIVHDLVTSYVGSLDDSLDVSGHGPWTKLSSPTLNADLSLALCYPAFYSERRNVTMHSGTNRTEPGQRWSRAQGPFTVPDVHHQMGEYSDMTADGSNSTAESRGILRLTSASKWAQDPQLSLKGYLALNQTVSGEALTAPQSGMFPIGRIYAYAFRGTTLDASQDLSIVTSVVNGAQDNELVSSNWPIQNAIKLDESLANIFITSLAGTNGSIATALSTMITILSQMAYYDQMPLFETSTDATQVFFDAIVFPQSTQGLLTVLLVTAAHFILVLMIAVRFALCSRYSTLGDYWQAVSQVLSSRETQALVPNSSISTDKEVRQHLKAIGKEHAWVAVEALEETDHQLALVCYGKAERT